LEKVYFLLNPLNFNLGRVFGELFKMLVEHLHWRLLTRALYYYLGSGLKKPSSTELLNRLLF
jgi:hypothetical protein